MPLTLVLPDSYEYVALAAVASTFVTTWQTLKVGGQRGKAGIKYPQMYAEKSEIAANKEALIFNNLQRAHQHTLESYPQFLTCLFITGLKYPIYAASIGGLWIFGRILFTRNYGKAAENRNKRGGVLGLASGFAIQIGAALTVLGFVRERLGY